MTSPSARNPARATVKATRRAARTATADQAEARPARAQAETTGAKASRVAARVARKSAKATATEEAGAEAQAKPPAKVAAKASRVAARVTRKAAKAETGAEAPALPSAKVAAKAGRVAARVTRKAAKAGEADAAPTAGALPVPVAEAEAAELVFSSVRRQASAEAFTPPPETALGETDQAVSHEAAQQPAKDFAPPSPVPEAQPIALPPQTQPEAAPDGENEDSEDDPGKGGRRRPRRDRKAGRNTDAAHYVVAPPVEDARMRPRHFGVIALFCLCVILPTISYSWYLWTRAADQYESDLGFGSRTEEGPSTFDFLGALTGGSQTGSKDMDILNQFVISQELVAKVDAELDLKSIWSRAKDDPLNSFHTEGTIEDLVTYWQRMVRVDYDNATGLMNLRIFAFDPQDARAIATSVLRESTEIVNQLSKTAQEDTTRYSKQMLAETQQKLAAARLAVLDYQVRNNIVDPSNVVSSQLSVVASLNQELANTQVELDLLSGTVPASDPRIATLQRKLEVIQNRITAERAKVGSEGQGAPGFATLMAEFETLKVEQDFAQQAYLSALAAHDQALADAQKKTRYLATYVAPTLAQAPTAPIRPLHAALVALAGFLIWSILVLTYYALRDRR